MQGIVSEPATQLEGSPHMGARRSTQSLSGQARLVVTLVPKNVRDRVDAAGLGLYGAVHTDSVREATMASANMAGVRAVLLSPQLISREDLPLVARAAHTSSAILAAAVSGKADIESRQRLIDLGACGVDRVLELAQRSGWQQLQSIVRSDHEEARAEIFSAVFMELSGAHDEVCRFFTILLNAAPAIRSVKMLAPRLHVHPQTLMSRFFRAGLPSPKQYVARVRLLYAAALLDERDISIASASDRLDYSSPQCFGRHVRGLMKLSAGQFRWRYSFNRLLAEFCATQIRPHRAVLAGFRPLQRRPAPIPALLESRRYH